jgi:hypothetical protein
MSDADVEITTIATWVALDYGRHLEKARQMLQVEGCILNMPGRSRFNLRWHRLADRFFRVISLLSDTW